MEPIVPPTVNRDNSRRSALCRIADVSCEVPSFRFVPEADMQLPLVSMNRNILAISWINAGPVIASGKHASGNVRSGTQ
jgi:hypothetical protein